MAEKEKTKRTRKPREYRKITFEGDVDGAPAEVTIRQHIKTGAITLALIQTVIDGKLKRTNTVLADLDMGELIDALTTALQ